MKQALLAFAVLFSLPLGAENLKTVPADLLQLKDTDLTTVRPLVVAKEGVYVCRNGYDMYVKTSATKGAIARVEPLSRARLIDTPTDKIMVICVAVGQ